MTVIDANVLLAALAPAHPKHAEAMAILAHGRLTVTWGTLQEVTQVTRRTTRGSGRSPNAAARAALDAVVSLAGYNEAPQVLMTEVAEAFRQAPSLSFVDAWNLVVARRTGEPLATFDQDLAKAATKRRQHSQ